MARGLLASAALFVAACAPSPAPQGGPRPDVSALFPEPAEPSADAPDPPASATATASAEPTCQSDADCGYDPVGRRCGADPRWNKQPPVVDQGIVCYCDAAAKTCALLRVDPAPCEGDSSCAVRDDPRPHPVRADAEHPYQKPRQCGRVKKGGGRRVDRYVTCERTNICTMHTRECAQP